MQIHNPRFLNPTLLNKFLVSKSYNVDKAIKQFEAYWKFRMEKDIDRLILDDFSRLQHFLVLYPREFYFNDKEGRPLLIERLGKANFSELFKVVASLYQQFEMSYLQKLFYLHYELLDRVILPECSRMAGREVSNLTAILDLKGIGMTDLMSKNVHKMLGTASQMPQDYYPESVYKTFVINTPMLFSTFFMICKPFLDSRTSSSLIVHGSKYQTDLLNHIHAELLPVEYGGMNQAPLNSVDKGPYAYLPQLCMRFHKWELSPEERMGYAQPGQGMPQFPAFPDNQAYQPQNFGNHMPSGGINYPSMPPPPN